MPPRKSGQEKCRKIKPGKISGKFSPEKSPRKNPDFEARKIWPEILRRKQSPKKAWKYIAEKTGENKALFQRPI